MIAILFEIYLSILRIFILIFGFYLTLLLGTSTVAAINKFLYGSYLPCLEIISFLITFIPPIAIFYGIKEQRYFWQKPVVTNVIVLSVSFVIGVILSFFSSDLIHAFVNTPATYCISPQDPLEQFYRTLGTGLVASVFGFIGVDIGVSLKHVSRKMVSPYKMTSKSKKKKR